MLPMSLFGLALKRISPPNNFPKYRCEKHGDQHVACVQYGTGIEAANIEQHMFCGMCFAENLSLAMPVHRVEEKVAAQAAKKSAA